MSGRPTHAQAVAARNRELARLRLVTMRDAYLEQSTAYLKAYAEVLGAITKLDERRIEVDEAEEMLALAKRYLGPTVREVGE